MTENRDTQTREAVTPVPMDGGDPVWRALPRRNTRKVSHLLADDLRRQILSGQLAADQQLPPEADLTAQLQISRETLREALRILESQQLVEIRRGRGGGAVVRRPGLDAVARYVALLLQLRKTTLAHLEEVRTVVEPPAAELLAAQAGFEDIETLVELHDAERAADSPLAFVTAMSAFDQAVIELSGNRTLAVIAGVFRDIYAGQVYSSIGSTDNSSAEQIARRVVVSHSAFLDAARRRDGALAQNTWSDYLYTTNRMLVSRNVSRQPIDVTPLWRAQAGHDSGESAPRRASVVATEIRARIAEGRLGEGDRLPPLAELAAEFDISRPTLREALRILEMEFLLDLRTGDRAGAAIRTPTTRVAAKLAGIVLEARGTTLADFHRGLRLIEPSIMGLVASRIGARQLTVLNGINTDLAESVEDTARFVTTYREAEKIAFSAVKNPALTVIAEILHWVRVAVEPSITADVTGLPWVTKSNRRTQGLFSQFVSAAADHDSARAVSVWTRAMAANVAWAEESEFSERLMLDLMG
ncbi:GntR family transcriptional regulator [Mycolicibacterium novocastrense]|uniref:FadR/GntR family transcriptional regulator n=1 Tax=Mycobacteriaceae TaxID=1762 RepID=UPI000747FB87|nr:MULTISPECIES: GntR family transcriptional regulator [Mycobacteriaceae]KUH67669.1 GntR family transcriptional regulator [Mycolicibacterium novocastrense]KUH75938.1 GntR family transcriptional regulator [Mycolicibacterium novocastrense]KUH78744.1 GntR family transcriptional regulator [Mycolicibacterium novocastrense]KUI34861.1 GntR family transcriptional regulator [Mycobacterium sp. IS-1590]